MLSPQDQNIENYGQYFENFKFPRTFGRIYGLLLITDQPYLGLDQIAAQLGVSKASISTVIRQLVGFMMVEKVTIPGNRRDYYRVSPKAAMNYLQSSIKGSLMFHGLIQETAKLENLTPLARQKVESIDHLYASLSQAFADFIANYEYQAKE
jgi:DNA-binding transcriptional regulator GbsR (MarR family)